MQEKIDSLTAEVIELRSNVTELRASLHQVISIPATATGGEPTAPTAASWTEVVRRGKKTVNNAGSRQQTRATQSQRNESKPTHVSALCRAFLYLMPGEYRGHSRPLLQE